MNKLFFIFLFIFILFLNVFPSYAADHSKFKELQQEFKTPEEVTKTCLYCHTTRGHEILETKHWNWKSISSIPGRKEEVDLGKANILNNFCVAVPSNYARCTSCHIGYGWKDSSFDFKNQEKIDCLVCHESTGTYKKFPVGAGYPVMDVESKVFKGNKKTYFKPDLNKVAQSVGNPTRKNCGTCHFFGGGGNNVKHGDLEKVLTKPDKSIDVHMGHNSLNMSCTKCHTATNHQIKGKYYASSSYPNKDEKSMGIEESRVTCAQCHVPQLEKESVIKKIAEENPKLKIESHNSIKKSDIYLNDGPPHNDKLINGHMRKVSCQACHIPTYAKDYPTKMYWDWSKAGKKNDKGKPIVKKALFQKVKDENGKMVTKLTPLTKEIKKKLKAGEIKGHIVVTYHAKKGAFEWDNNVVPTYAWFNGSAKHVLIQDKIDPSKAVKLNELQGSYEDPNSKIWPIKVHKGKQMYDKGNNTMAVPKLFGKKGSGAYWAEFDWSKSVEAGMKEMKADFSGEVGWVESELSLPLNHMVAETSKTVSCIECHQKDGRLEEIKGVYIPGRDKNIMLDGFGIFIIIASAVLAIGHAFMRVISKK